MLKMKNISLIKIVTVILLLVWALIVVYPMIWTLLGSLKNNMELYENPWGLPEVLRFENYAKPGERLILVFIFSTAFSSH